MTVSIFANTTCEPHNNVSRSHFTPLLDPRTLTSRQRHQRCVITLQVYAQQRLSSNTLTQHIHRFFSQTKFEKIRVDHNPTPQAGFCQGTLKPALPVTTIRVVDLVNVFFNVSIRVIGTCTLLSGVGIFRFFEVTPRHSKGVES